MVLLIALLSGAMFAGLVYYLVAGVKFNAAWQPGESPLARHLNNRRRARFNDQLPDALATMSNALRAGLSINQAFESVIENGQHPLSDEFRILVQSIKVGMSMEEALETMTERVGSEDLLLVNTAILISRKTGGNVTEIFDKISDTIRARMKIERKIKTLTAQGKLQGIIVSLMPVFLALIMTMLKPEMMIGFFLSPVGAISVLVTIVLIVLGWWMISKIVKIDI
ncbi:MAG: type II secretion system F family protein [Kiritimatiellae bacterium]|nr:type II secretion system F family protein [Kiritimatiellia bacterium]